MVYRFPWDAPRDHHAEFALYSHGIAERMPAGVQRYHLGVDDWLVIYFYEEAKAGGSGGVQDIPAHSLMVWKPGEVRVYGRESASWTHSWLQVTGSRVAPTLKAAGISPGRPWLINSAARFDHGIRELHDEAMGFDIPSARILGNLFENWLLRLARGAGGERDQRLRSLRLHLDTHTAVSLSLEEMARLAGMSASHFSALFKAAYGKSPVAYHIFRRIDEAKYLLAQRGLSVSEVAERTGYPDLFSFSRMFKRVTGFSPREMHKRESDSSW